MFSNNGQLHIPVSGGTSWVRVPEGSKYSSQERCMDGNLYALESEVYKPIRSTPTAYTGNRDINTELSIQNYEQNYARRKELEEQERRQQEALINKQLDMAASDQYNLMDKLYKQGGLDEMRKEYNRVRSADAESIYTKAAYNALCAKDKEEASIREETTKAANNYYNDGGIDNLKYLINFYKSRGEFKYASVAQSVLNTKEKEEAINTIAVTESANNYYETGGMDSLKHLVKYYEENSYPVNANIAKRILKQKEEKEREEEHNRRMQQDSEYAENYKIKETEGEISKLEKEIAEQKKIDPFYGQPSSAAMNERIKAFEYTKGLSYEAAKAYLDELKLPKNARFENSKIGADVALKYYFDTVIPLQNKIEQAKAKIQEIENIRTERMLKQKEEQEHEKLKQAEKIINKAIEVNNTKINRFRNIADMADDILHKRSPNDLHEDFDDKISKTLKSTFEGVKEKFVGTGEFIGEEVARLHLGEKTKTRQRLEDINTFFEEEKECFDTGQTTKTGQAIKDIGNYIKKEGELIATNEKTQTGQFARDTYRKIKDTPAEDIGHGVGKFVGEMLIGFGIFKGASTLVNGTGKIVNAVKTAKRSASLSEVKLVGKSLEKSNQSMLRMWDSYKNNSLPNSVADNLRLRAELAFKQAGILDSEGRLTAEAIRLSKDAWKDGSIVKNPAIKDILIKDGSKIEDWTKLTTPTIELSNGQRVQIHYYKNIITNKIDYVTHDFKVKGRVESLDGELYWKNVESEFVKNLPKNE